MTAVDGNGDGKVSGVTTHPKNTPGGPDWEYYALDNRLGSVMALLDRDKSGTVLESYRYDAFGQPAVLASIVGSGPALSPGINPFLFTARRVDTKAGLSEYRMRNLEAISGRFVKRDPLGAWFDPLQQGNAYSYSANNPTNHFDPYGTQIFPIISIYSGSGDLFISIDLFGCQTLVDSQTRTTTEGGITTTVTETTTQVSCDGGRTWSIRSETTIQTAYATVSGTPAPTVSRLDTPYIPVPPPVVGQLDTPYIPVPPPTVSALNVLGKTPSMEKEFTNLRCLAPNPDDDLPMPCEVIKEQSLSDCRSFFRGDGAGYEICVIGAELEYLKCTGTL